MKVLGDKPNFFSLLRLKRRCCAFFNTLSVWMEHFNCGPIDVDGDMLSLLSPEVQFLNFLDDKGEIIFPASLCREIQREINIYIYRERERHTERERERV